MTGTDILLYPFAQFDTVHNRHHYITNDKIRDQRNNLVPSFFSVRCGLYPIIPAKAGNYIVFNVRIVFYDQQ